MVFSLDSSLVLVAIVGLWLVWVAPFLLRRAVPDLAAHPLPVTNAGTTRSRKTVMTMSAFQDDRHRGQGAPQADFAGTTAGTTTGAFADSDGAARSARVGLGSVHWGRLCVALVGALALLSVPVTLVLTVLGLVPVATPLIGVAVAAAAVVTLRTLALRSRRARVDRAFAEAMAPVRPDAAVTAPAASVVPAPRRPTALFDADETQVRVLTAMELRTAALAVAHGSTVVDIRPEAEEAEGSVLPENERTTGAAWAPVELPRPTYVDAAKVERQAPAPLDLPEAPKPSSRTPIKAAEAAARSAEAPDPSADRAPATGRINLDDVLQRRRA
ncbi:MULTISPECIES: hypothetical protein [unclassified Arthrobacter]|uniref:hypothetical protein n=1 Tax=Arthrobacter sp. N1 TaxID=619291 RepID=UPI003BB0B7AA